ncbi:hypothetical protein [Chryseolinea lacunae]|uniref:Uncharacterized protein n=1 Tax=Chryseolinea lacunae TaxID=2801331 RepID=A0ABS1KPW8_9BACT|nr:hypothetical protein [Chryseolinea lacunae]MBL0740737.1 hypothetical protein [Chryseolinea lacunae]
MQPEILKATVFYNDGQMHLKQLKAPYDARMSVEMYIACFEELIYKKTNAFVVIVIDMNRTLHDNNGNYLLTDDGEICFQEIYIV